MLAPLCAYCHGEKGTGFMNCVLKDCTMGATRAMAARQGAAARAPSRAAMHAVASG